MVKGGDREAFSALVEKYHRPLLGFIYHLMGEASQVEDIGQEVLFGAYRALGHFDLNRGTPFSAWLFTIALNRCLGELRKKGRQVSLEGFHQLPSPGLDPEEALKAKEKLTALGECLKQLPEAYQHSLLGRLEGDSDLEQARKAGAPLGTVKARLSRARGMLRVLLKKRLGGP